jgi:hypothetical protein
MNNYQDRFTRFHDKPTDGRNPSSNNGFIYTAYAKHIVPDMVDQMKITECVHKCLVDKNKFQINRNPNDPTPPLSRDEVMGILSIYKNTGYGDLLYKCLKSNHWNFCNLPEYEKKPLNLNRILTAADILYDIKDEHRNTVWKENMIDAYPLAFRLPPSDIYYLKRLYGDKPNMLERLHFYAETLQSVYKGDKSGRVITWLKIKDLGLEDTFLGKKVIAREKQSFEEYLGKEHILTKNI